MPKISKTRLAVGMALAAYVGPRIAKDKKFDVVPYVKDLTAKTYKAEIKGIVTKLCKDAEPMLAPDPNGAAGKMGPDDVIHMLASHIIGGEAPSAEAQESDEMMPAEEGMEESPALDEAARKYLTDHGMDEEGIAGLAKLLGGEKKGEDESEKDKDDDKPVTKEAMDAAIKKANDEADRKIKAAQDSARDAAEAREFVRPWAGAIAMSHDTAEKIYRATAKHLGIDVEPVKDVAALKLIIERTPKPGARPAGANDSNHAVDSSVEAEMAKRHPHGARIGLN